MKAFPSYIRVGEIVAAEQEGMDLRDYFAAMAMQAEYTKIGVEGNDPMYVAKMAYAVADAMMKARQS